MIRKPPLGLFVTGTSTEVGKTYVAAQIVRALTRLGRTVGVYKPVASGCVRREDQLVAEDAVALWEASGRRGTLQQVCPQRFEAPLAPHRAAAAEGRQVDAELLRTGIEAWFGRCDVLVVEGAGGLMSPISDDDYVADLASDFGYPLIVVAANQLGVINATLQTLVTAETFREGLTVAGIMLNDVTPSNAQDISRTSNLVELQQRCVAPVLAHVQHGQQELPDDVDWTKLLSK